MNFSIGTMGVGITGHSVVSDTAQEILSLCSDPAIDPELIFDFVEELPKAENPLARVEEYSFWPDRIRVREKVFEYEVSLGERPVRVSIAMREKRAWKRAMVSLRKGWRYYHTHGQGAYLHYLKRFVFYVYMPWVQMMLLRKGAAFCHSSAIVRDGKGILFPAWGGVGKTGIMSLYLEEGWQFLSDDFCILDQHGGMYLHPMPMHIYKFHEMQCESLAKRMLAGCTPKERFLWTLCRGWKKPDRLVRWISPEKVFGRDNLSRQAQLRVIVQLHRSGECREIEIHPCSEADVARSLTNILLDEINNIVELSLFTHSCMDSGLIPNLSNLYQTIYQTYYSAFSGKPCYRVSIPYSAGMKDIFAVLNKSGLF